MPSGTPSPGSWSGIGPVSFAYGWALGGSTLEGVSGQLYVPSADQAGATISCVVSATDNVATSTQASAPVRVLTPGEPPGVPFCRGAGPVAGG